MWLCRVFPRSMFALLVAVLCCTWVNALAATTTTSTIRSLVLTVEGKSKAWDNIRDEFFLTVSLNTSSEPMLTLNMEPQEEMILTVYTSLIEPLVEVVGGTKLSEGQKTTVMAQKGRCVLNVYGRAPSVDQWVLLLVQDSSSKPLLIVTASSPTVDELQPEDKLLQRLEQSILDSPISELRKQYYLQLYYQAQLMKTNGQDANSVLANALDELNNETVAFREAELAINNIQQLVTNKQSELSTDEQQMASYFLEKAQLYAEAGRYQDALKETENIMEILNPSPISYVTPYVLLVVVVAAFALIFMLLLIKRRRGVSSIGASLEAPAARIPP